MKRLASLFLSMSCALALLAAAPDKTCVPVSASDLVERVCGTIDADTQQQAFAQSAMASLGVEPQSSPEGEWLDGEDGYALVYQGMNPDVSVLVRFENGVIADYTYFFTFPLDEESEQRDFCHAMLQELHDGNADLGVNTMATETLFQVVGTASGRDVELSLLEDDAQPQYVLIMEVHPSSSLTAQNR